MRRNALLVSVAALLLAFAPVPATVTVTGNQLRVTTSRHGVARLTITYQRQLADGSYRDVANTGSRHSAPVAVTVPVISR